MGASVMRGGVKGQIQILVFILVALLRVGWILGLLYWDKDCYSNN